MTCRRSDRTPLALSAVAAFSFALGVGRLALPLLALAAGYDAAGVGLLTATSAISQFLFRLRLPFWLGRYRDRALVAVACLMMAASYLAVFASVALPVFIAAQLLQGGARALFWTASQTHAVRAPGVPVRQLAEVATVGNVGTMIGPATTGFVATALSLSAALWMGVVVALVGAGLAMTLHKLEPYPRRARAHGEARLWRKPGIDVACWAGFAGGGWRALQSSYVPVILTAAGLPAGIVGILLSASDLASTIAIAALVRFPPRYTVISLHLAVMAAGIGLAILPFVAGMPVLAGMTMMFAGAGAGPLMTLSVAMARQLADPADEGEAIALIGTFRAGALLVTPTAVALSLAVLTVGAAMSIAGIAIAVPATALSLRQRARAAEARSG